MAIATNKQITDAVNGTMNAARATLVLSLTILEGVINFAIDIYRSTFFCFLELVVRGGLGVLIGAVQEVHISLSNFHRTSLTLLCVVQLIPLGHVFDYQIWHPGQC